MLRRMGAVLIGLLVVGVVVAALQIIGTRLYPIPEGLDPMNPAHRDAFIQHLAGMPAAGWLLAFGFEVVGAFLGALAAGWIVRDSYRAFSGAIVGLALCGSIFNWVSFPHPIWFMVAQVVAYALALTLVWRLLGSSGPSRAAPAAPTG